VSLESFLSKTYAHISNFREVYQKIEKLLVECINLAGLKRQDPGSDGRHKFTWYNP